MVLDLLVMSLHGGVTSSLVLGDPSTVVDLLVMSLHGGVTSSLVLGDPGAVVLLDIVSLHGSMESLLVFSNPSTVVLLDIMILPAGVESLLVFSNPSTVVFLDFVILPLGLESLLVLIDPSAVLLLDILKSHLSFWSLFVDPNGGVVNSGNKSLWTLNNVIFGSPFVSNVRLPSSLMSPVGFVVLVWLLDVDVISSGPSSVLPVEVWKIGTALVWLPYESAVVVGPNESVEPMAVLSMLPDKNSLVMPLMTKLRDCSVSGDHVVSKDWSVDPMVAGNSNNSSG
jgi:hypothetical protein